MASCINDNTKLEDHRVTFLVVGGGIAGVTCAETLAVYHPEESIILLTESSVIKTIANLEPVARFVYKFDVKERSLEDSSTIAPAIITIVDQLKHIEASKRHVETENGCKIYYKSICLCTGAVPHLIHNDTPLVIGIRDTDSVLILQQRLGNAKSVVLLGNGGIASELAYELHGVELHWVIKDAHIASTFVDAGAAHFFQESIQHSKTTCEHKPVASSIVKRLRYAEILSEGQHKNVTKHGAALGPDWHRNFTLKGNTVTELKSPIMHYKAHIKQIREENSMLFVTLSNGEQIKCDFLVSATGVEPRHNYSCSIPLCLASDGGIAVNDMMETNVEGIYAAGDVCTCVWEHGEHWFQMRLWTQARQMGCMAARSMGAKLRNEVIYQDFCFELFGHVTHLFGYPVILLGLYNGQGLGNDYEILLRSTPQEEYTKFVLQNGRLRGAILIGNSELAETCENLILNGIDLTPYGDDILNPNIDIEDYFD
ncbi:PREDICTED: pyridine nucleotide-disulfide oxidoreductase domain-containing protein 1 [Rhagoletis zephyria]|uniref:pyridine nucleotide-disulfide oxidoreductase domain-containing protein 1 n=1 Tax=Rhagoletis zephyria TaxID=28612 RepID=UPI0008119139|nr:PREDICTED: pyridine nucleotide-disulfide oxidoreductase domain-containing protein 1 [Rhagoletis zephyria]XP_036320794.1 pyridine nucleotide-disulfide oxidoreductase domain-containing protein 1 [Rhagoletis pomonella]